MYVQHHHHPHHDHTPTHSTTTTSVLLLLLVLLRFLVSLFPSLLWKATSPTVLCIRLASLFSQLFVRSCQMSREYHAAGSFSSTSRTEGIFEKEDFRFLSSSSSKEEERGLGSSRVCRQSVVLRFSFSVSRSLSSLSLDPFNRSGNQPVDRSLDQGLLLLLDRWMIGRW